MENQPYRYSKRVAEKAAWEFAQAHPDLHLAVINPSGTLGPLAIGRADGECVQLMRRIMEGGDNGVVSSQTIGWVDVRDVAEAHIRAMHAEIQTMLDRACGAPGARVPSPWEQARALSLAI